MANLSKKNDIAIEGQGFYQIVAESKRGIRWMGAVQGFDGRAAYCDDQNYTQDIADEAVLNGLRVTVNGKRYLGNNRVAS